MKTKLTNKLLAALCAVVLLLGLTPVAFAEDVKGVSAPSRNINYPTYYNGFNESPIRSYLYANAKGGLTRVEYFGSSENAIVVEEFDSNFQFQYGSRKIIDFELSTWGGFYAGAQYNFLIFGQGNSSESDSAEVVRVVKYDKDWKRLGQASVYGANTTIPFRSGTVRCVESGGTLYVHTSHQMYKSSDGLNHQANMRLAIRESDMTVTDSNCTIGGYSGYVSHSFNQFILRDQEGNILTADHGDGHPRAMVINRVTGKTGSVQTESFPGNIGNNQTNAGLGGFAETSNGYLISYVQDMKVKISYIAKSNFKQGTGNTFQTKQISTYSAKNDVHVGVSAPVLVPTGLNGGYIIWMVWDSDWNEGTVSNRTLYFAAYDANGNAGQVYSAPGAISDCQPIVYNGKVVWYTTNDLAPVFYTLDGSGLKSTPTKDGRNPNAAPTTLTTSVPAAPSGLSSTSTPTTPTAPTTPTTPTTPASPSASGKLTVETAMLAPSTFGGVFTIDKDGSLYGTYGGVTMEESSAAGVFKAKAAAPYCFVDENGSLWIKGFQGCIDGSASLESSKNPAKVMDNVRCAEVIDWADEASAMALKTDGTLWRWGTGTAPGKAVKVMDSVAQFRLIGGTWYALKTDGTLWQGYQNETEKKLMDGIAAFSVDETDNVYLAIRKDGSLWGWGVNSACQMGQGNNSGRTSGMNVLVETPVKILDNAVCAYAEAGQCFAVTADGSLYAWGENGEGQLGFTGTNYTASVSDGGGGTWTYQCQSTPKKVADGVVTMRYGLIQKEDGSLCKPGKGSLQQVSSSGLMKPGADSSAAPAAPAGPSKPSAPSGTVSFPDVSAGFWAYDAIQDCAGRGIVGGYADGRFGPDDPLTTAQFIALVTRTFYGDKVAAVTAPAGEPWYYANTSVAKELGLDSGVRFDSFLMERAISRYDMAQILYNIILEAGKALPRSDARPIAAAASLPDWSSVPLDRQSAVRECVAQNIITGLSNGKFGGNYAMTRAQACVVIQRMMGLIGG